jgi:hypothetical protein
MVLLLIVADVVGWEAKKGLARERSKSEPCRRPLSELCATRQHLCYDIVRCFVRAPFLLGSTTFPIALARILRARSPPNESDCFPILAMANRKSAEASVSQHVHCCGVPGQRTRTGKQSPFP